MEGPDVHDWKKLRQLFRYLRVSRDLTLKLEAYDTYIITCWVDAAFGVHPDMQSQSGGVMSMSRETVYGSSVRQNLSTKSSTEAELVATDDFMPQILWRQRGMR